MRMKKKVSASAGFAFLLLLFFFELFFECMDPSELETLRVVRGSIQALVLSTSEI